jgi:hypothetical protein
MFSLGSRQKERRPGPRNLQGWALPGWDGERAGRARVGTAPLSLSTSVHVGVFGLRYGLDLFDLELCRVVGFRGKVAAGHPDPLVGLLGGGTDGAHLYGQSIGNATADQQPGQQPAVVVGGADEADHGEAAALYGGGAAERGAVDVDLDRYLERVARGQRQVASRRRLRCRRWGGGAAGTPKEPRLVGPMIAMIRHGTKSSQGRLMLCRSASCRPSSTAWLTGLTAGRFVATAATFQIDSPIRNTAAGAMVQIMAGRR